MKNLLSKMGHFFEAHIEKLILAISVLISFWLLVTCVALSPNRIEYMGQKFSPGAIDEHISRNQLEAVRTIVNGRPQPMEQYPSKLDEYINTDDPVREGIRGSLDKGFMSLLTSAIDYIDSDQYPPLPQHSTSKLKMDKRDYQLPTIGHIEDVDVEHIRAAAYIPTEPLAGDASYTEVKHAPNDVDIITVQATFNMALLVYKFQECFAGEDVPEAWRDPVLAKPIFAAVHLQRQKQLENGNWDVWEDVPRCGTDHRHELFRIIEQVSLLPPGGVKMRMLQYSRPEVMADLVQPLPYQIASPYEEWFPPALHREFLAAYEKQKIQERRASREERTVDDTGTDRRGGLRGRGPGSDARLRGGDPRAGVGGLPGYSLEDPTARGAGARGRRGRTDGSARMTDTGGRGSRRTRRLAPGMDDMMGMGMGLEGDMAEESAVLEIYEKLFEIFITPQMDIYEQQKLVFWAHDDTPEPGHTYRYRVRLGVFNPIAGTRHINDAYKDKANSVVLWSEFSEVTKPVAIPSRQYFFANKYHPETDVLSVEVAQFVLGYWHIGKFQMKPGEVLGQIKEVTLDSDKTRDERRTRSIRGLQTTVSSGRPNSSMPDEIDYSTGIVWIGAEPVDRWVGGSRLRRQSYYDMLYTHDGSNIQRTPIGTSNWPDTLSEIYNQINRTRRESPEALRAFGSGIDGGESLFDYRRADGLYGRGEFGLGRGGY